MKIVLKVIAVLGVIGSMMVGAQAADWVAGEIRRVDAANSKLTIKHEEIKSLDMPPMTMVFYVKDSNLLSGLNPQDKIEFQAISEGTKYFITAVRR
jgi:Cu/Ag efflux protein CusF